MTDVPQVGIDVSGKVIILHQLEQELNDGGVPTPHGLTIAGPPRESVPNPPPSPLDPPLPCTDGSRLFTYDDQGSPADLPPEAAAIVEAYQP